MGASRSTRRPAAMAALLCALAMMPATPVFAQVDNNVGGWVGAVTLGDFGGVSEKLSSITWWFDTQVRLRNDVGGFGQALFRPGLGWAFSEQGGISAGYAYILSSPAVGGNFGEHRAWQQFTWSEPSGRFDRFWRTRLEERFSDKGSDVGVRLRQLLRTSIAVRKGSRFSIVGWDEFFFHLRDTNWDVNAGFDQNRFFIGMGWRVDQEAHATFELGYMNQFVKNASRPNSVNHIISLWMFFR